MLSGISSSRGMSDSFHVDLILAAIGEMSESFQVGCFFLYANGVFIKAQGCEARRATVGREAYSARRCSEAIPMSGLLHCTDERNKEVYQCPRVRFQSVANPGL